MKSETETTDTPEVTLLVSSEPALLPSQPGLGWFRLAYDEHGERTRQVKMVGVTCDEGAIEPEDAEADEAARQELRRRRRRQRPTTRLLSDDESFFVDVGCVGDWVLGWIGGIFMLYFIIVILLFMDHCVVFMHH